MSAYTILPKNIQPLVEDHETEWKRGMYEKTRIVALKNNKCSYESIRPCPKCNHTIRSTTTGECRNCYLIKVRARLNGTFVATRNPKGQNKCKWMQEHPEYNKTYYQIRLQNKKEALDKALMDLNKEETNKC